MSAKRKVEVFSAGCQVCEDAIALVKKIASPSCEVSVLNMNDINVAKRAKQIGIRTVPAMVIEGQLAQCCAGSGLDEQVLKLAGLGKAR